MSLNLSILTKGIQHRGIQTFLLLSIYFLSANLIPLKTHQSLYTLSILIKDIIVWFLPPIVAIFIANAIFSFQKKAPLFIITLIGFEAFSNFISVWYAYLGAHIASNVLPEIAPIANSSELALLWRFPFLKPSFWSPEKGSLVGTALGFIAIASKQSMLQTCLCRSKEIAQFILSKFFSRLIPLFILGFVARMYKTELLFHMFSQYGLFLMWMIGFLTIYIALLFLIGGGWQIHLALKHAKNLLSAGTIAFTSGCSLSTMPWTIAGTSKNLKKPELAEGIIPATTNIQQIGDCIANAFLCFLIFKHFYGHAPPLEAWVGFSIYFVLARFATAAILGGAIFIMLPIYETHLSFSAEMTAIILAFNVILDPLITCCNVVANGALCRIFEMVWLALLKKKTIEFF